MRRWPRALLTLAVAGVAQLALAQRFDARRAPAAQPLAEAVGVAADTVRTFVLPGPHGHRYRIQVAALGPPPAAGYPVLYLLDGNAAMAALTAAPAASAPEGSVLLVAVGYETEAYFDTDARALDYTPPLADGRPVVDPRVPGRRGGGADDFLDFLAQQLMPRIAAQWPVHATQRGIWGHSYGGLLVLHALFKRPGMFAFHAAASPSLWWHAPLMAQSAQAFAAGPAAVRPTRLLLLHGEREQRRGVDAAPPGGQALIALARTLAAAPGVLVQRRDFAGLGHGAMFSAALGPAIRAFATAASQAARAKPSISAAK